MKADLVGVCEDVLEKSRQLFGRYNKWTSSAAAQPDSLEQDAADVIEAIEAFTTAAEGLTLNTHSLNELHEQVRRERKRGRGEAFLSHENTHTQLHN